MSYIPKNVKDFVARNLEMEQASHYAGSLKKGNVHASWYEKDAQRQTNPPKQHPMMKDSAQAKHVAGMKLGIATVKAARQERLKELYTAEAVMYEAELSSMGLSLVKPID